MKRLAAAIGATLMISTATLMLSGAPAGASTQPVVNVKPNQPVVIHGSVSPVSGPGTAYGFVFGYQPSDCSDDGNAFAFCDYYPVRLVDNNNKPLTADALAKNLYALTFTLSWNGDHVDAPPLGSFDTSQMQMTVWNDPPKPKGETEPCDPAGAIVNFYLCTLGLPSSAPNGDDAAYYDSGAFASPQPLNFGLADPKHNAYAVQVANDAATSFDYTLTVSLIETSGSLADLSVDIPPVDQSALPALPTVVGPPANTQLPTVSGGTVTLNSADIGADSQLDNLNAGGDNLDLNDTNNVLRANALKPLRKPGRASALLMVLWLVVLPLALFAAAAAYLMRRRSDVFSI